MSEIFNRAKTFGHAVANHMADGFKQVAEEEYDRRISICHKCDKYEAGPNRCGQCGCFLKVKAAWNSEKCPLDKW